MKTKILFVMESLGIGGAEKSLVTILSSLDYSKYDVDLLLFRESGAFMELLPKEVNLIKVSDDFRYFSSPPKESIAYFIKNKKINLLSQKIMSIIKVYFNRFVMKKEYIGWKHTQKSIKMLDKHYDSAIGFLEKKTIYFVVDKVKADRKIGFIHTDYDKIDYDFDTDNRYFKNLDNIITVSDSCKDGLVKIFKEHKEKVEVIQNIISPTVIKDMVKEDNSIIKEDIITISTIARLEKQKGIDIAIKCCEELVKRDHKFKWIVVGEGSQREYLENSIKEKNLESYFYLIGSKTNPYPYIDKSDIYVQPSRLEGFGITVAEAKVLQKPILVNNIAEFRNQIKDNNTGLIYTDELDMVNKLELLITNAKKRDELINNLKEVDMNNLDEIKKLEKIL